MYTESQVVSKKKIVEWNMHFIQTLNSNKVNYFQASWVGKNCKKQSEKAIGKVVQVACNSPGALVLVQIARVLGCGCCWPWVCESLLAAGTAPRHTSSASRWPARPGGLGASSSSSLSGSIWWRAGGARARSYLPQRLHHHHGAARLY